MSLITAGTPILLLPRDMSCARTKLDLAPPGATQRPVRRDQTACSVCEEPIASKRPDCRSPRGGGVDPSRTALLHASSNGNTALAGRHCRNASEPVLASGDRFEVGAGAKRVSRRPFGRRYGRRSRSCLRLVSSRDSAAAIEQRYLQVGAVFDWALRGCRDRPATLPAGTRGAARAEDSRSLPGRDGGRRSFRVRAGLVHPRGNDT